MGTVHKFKRPPKNEGQFKGYRPNGSGGPPRPPSGRWPRRDWQKSVLAWLALVLVATAFWGIGRFF